MRKSFWKLYNEVLTNNQLQSLKEYVYNKLEELRIIVKNTNTNVPLKHSIALQISDTQYELNRDFEVIELFPELLRSIYVRLDLIRRFFASNNLNSFSQYIQDIISYVRDTEMPIGIAGDAIMAGDLDSSITTNTIHYIFSEIQDLLYELQAIHNNIIDGATPNNVEIPFDVNYPNRNFITNTLRDILNREPPNNLTEFRHYIIRVNELLFRNNFLSNSTSGSSLILNLAELKNLNLEGERAEEIINFIRDIISQINFISF